MEKHAHFYRLADGSLLSPSISNTAHNASSTHCFKLMVLLSISVFRQSMQRAVEATMPYIHLSLNDKIDKYLPVFTRTE